MIKKRLLVRPLLGFILLLFSSIAWSQNKTVTGVVTSEAGTPLEKASITAKGQSGGVSTDALGVFKITVPTSATTLVISYVGYERQEVSIKDLTSVTITLQVLRNNLDSVVVVGYGTQRRKDITGAIASVRGEAIKNLPVTNIAEALQGRVAGVEVIKSSGEPGAPTQITIRGVSSLFQPQPLYIIDGVPQSGDNINVQDIASIEVLKDASAAAIYGSAAAGGVILVTTKKGQGPKPTINLSTRYGVTTPRLLDLLDKNDFVRLKQLTKNSYYMGLTQQGIDTLPDTDWSDQIFRNGTEENYNLSVTGSTPNVNYFVSGVLNKQKGVYIDNSSNLSGARVNTDIKVSNHIKIGEQINFWQRNSNPVGTSPVNPPFRSVPTMSVYSGNPNAPWGINPPGFAGPNIVAQILTSERQFKQMNFQGNAFAEIKLPLYLTLRTTLGYTYYTEERNIFQDKYNAGPGSTIANNHLYKNFLSNKTLYYNYILSFDHSYGKHTINALAGYEQNSSIYSAISVDAKDVGGSSFAYIGTSTSSPSLSNGGYDPNGLIKSIFGRINYDFNKKYFASFSVRRDGNFTVFGTGNQYGVFPGGSVGWRLSEEPFIKKALPQFNLLKLRGSYGLLGNSAIGQYRFISTYDQVNSQNYFPGADPTLNYTQNSIANPNIKWESLYESNVGLDGEVFNGKLYFSLDWYRKTTKDLLYEIPLPTSSGFFNRFPGNIGSVRNTGEDILIGYKNNFRDINYNISVTGSFNKNKVLNLDGINNNPIYAGDNYYGDPSFGVWPNQNLTKTIAGASFGQLYGLKAIGIFQTDAEAAGHTQFGQTPHAGDLIYQDVSGNGTIGEEDRTVIGNAYPKFTYGANINVSYKGFDLAMLFNGVSGVDIFNGVAPYALFPFADGNTTSKVFGASFLGNNQLTSQPRIGVVNGNSFTPDPNKNYLQANSFFVENGSYLKLKNLQLGYNFSGSLLEKASIKTARIFVMANNLFTITKYSGIDPELGSQNIFLNGGTTTRGIDAPFKYPNSRIYSVGIDLTF